MTTLATFTPTGLQMDGAHVYTHDGRVFVSVTQALTAAALCDRAWFTEDDRLRGSRVHAAIARWHAGQAQHTYQEIGGYLRAYQRFLAESAFRVDASEEMIADLPLRCAGTLDLRGEFIAPALASEGRRIDVIDLKTGTTPPWVGYQVAGYVRLLPLDVRARCRRWSLALRHDGTYRLEPLTTRSDEAVFMAAVTIAHAKKGWLA